MRYDDGFKLFVGALSPEYYVDTSKMSQSTFDKTLTTLHDSGAKKNVMDDLRSFREEWKVWPKGIRELSLVPS